MVHFSPDKGLPSHTPTSHFQGVVHHCATVVPEGRLPDSTDGIFSFSCASHKGYLTQFRQQQGVYLTCPLTGSSSAAHPHTLTKSPNSTSNASPCHSCDSYRRPISYALHITPLDPPPARANSKELGLGPNASPRRWTVQCSLTLHTMSSCSSCLAWPCLCPLDLLHPFAGSLAVYIGHTLVFFLAFRCLGHCATSASRFTPAAKGMRKPCFCLLCTHITRLSKR